MRKLYYTFVVLLLFFNLSAVLEETASLQEFMYGSTDQCEYDNWVSHVAEGIASNNYNLYAPWDRQTTGFGDYAVPSDQDLFSWDAVIDMFLDGDLVTVETFLDVFSFPYQVLIFHDTDTDNTYHMLREIPNEIDIDNNNTPNDPSDDEIGAFQFGWGLYIFNPESSNPLIITTPHPNDDYITVPVATRAFQEWDAMFYISSGTGREVKWTHVGSYTNSKSLCDPSRIESHPFNVGYQYFCDYIRDQFDRRELSVQIHSYDWGTRHEGYANTQISAGWGLDNPGLPIRDLSTAGRDIVNVGSSIMHFPNDVGMHPQVDINEFYTFNYSVGDFFYTDADTAIVVNNVMDLPGYRNNRQFVYSHNGWNDYDVFEPFFHIEMDELPNIYPQTQANYKWFHGWDEINNKWDVSKRFAHFFDYYMPWVDQMTVAIPYAFELDDGIEPNQIQNPVVLIESLNKITLSWDVLDCFDFDTYQILYSTEPIANDNYLIYDRTNKEELASTISNEATIPSLDQNQQYYFQIQAVDKQGNISPPSQEITASTGLVRVDDIDTYSSDSQIIVSWQAEIQSLTQGYSVYRRTSDTDFQRIDSWETNLDLVSNNTDNQNFIYYDTELENYEQYYYRIASTSLNGVEIFHNSEIYASPSKVFELIFAQTEGDYSDTLFFGMSPFASNLYDTEYDYESTDEETGNHFFTYFHEPEWAGYPYYDPTTYYQEIHGLFDQNEQYKKWKIRFKTNQLNDVVTVSINNLDRNAERMYLVSNDVYYDLLEGNFQFIPTASAFYEFDLYWGNITPQVDFSGLYNHILVPGETMDFNVAITRQTTVDHYEVFARNDSVSIPIGLNLEPSSNQFSWMIPQLYFDNLKIVAELHMNEGDILTYESDSSFGIIPGAVSINSKSGLKLINYPYDDFVDDIYTVYGDSSFFYYLIDNVYIPTTDIFPNHSYWHYSPNNYIYDATGLDYERATFSVQTSEGWNLIPNPYVIDYRIEQILFRYNGVNYDYNEAIQFRLIEPFFICYDNNFIHSNTIKSLESAALYCYADDIELKFEPYHEPPFSPDFEYNWTYDLLACQEIKERARITVGTSDWASFGYDKEYDLLQPENRPIEDNIVLGLYHDFYQLDEDLCLGQSIISELSQGDSLNYQWDGYVKVDSLLPIEFFGISRATPEQCNIYLLIGELIYPLTDSTSVLYTPTEHEFAFTLLFTEEFLTESGEDTIPNKIILNNFPNPFNPLTNIAFSIPTASKVNLGIYNIKGQLVKTVAKDFFEAGNYQRTWNGKDNLGKSVGSGVYFYKLQSDNKQLIRKMLLLK